MHYTGTIWRPPYEAESLLLEATAGCTHHRCRFCTLYQDIPFRMAPLRELESDLQEAQLLASDPIGKLSARLQGLAEPEKIRRVFLVGANPFVLSPKRLEAIRELVGGYLPSCRTIGCFARVTDIAAKTDGELHRLGQLGYDGLTIGVETGDGQALAFMDKGYGPEDIVEQCRRLDGAGIGYRFMYLAGLPGAGRGMEGAAASAEVFNRTHPQIIGSSMLTVFRESRLYRELEAGNWAEESEVEKLEEVRTLVERLDIPVWFATLGASNAVLVQGNLPEERPALLAKLDAARDPAREEALRRYRRSLPHL